MKVVVIGGTGLIGSKVVAKLSEHGHNAVAAAPSTGVDTLTGQGLAEALTGADVVVDVSNAPVWEDDAVLEFFETSTRNLLSAEQTAGVRHHVALSVVGTELLLESGYFRAKLAQEKLIESSPVPFSIVRATQFFEFVPSIADASTDGARVHLKHVFFQPMAGADVAQAVARVAVGSPLKGTLNVAGPERFRMDDFFRDVLAAGEDQREVVTDPDAVYFGISPSEYALVPGDDAQRGETSYGEWVRRNS
jgi:uncharacterized protein YbjT (DUF2867 family)